MRDPGRVLKESTYPGPASILVQDLIGEACDDVLNDLLWRLTALILVGDEHCVCLQQGIMFPEGKPHTQAVH